MYKWNIIFVIIISCISSKINADYYYDNFDSFENMLRSADYIVYGKINHVEFSIESYKNASVHFRNFDFEKITIIKNRLNQRIPQNITIKTVDAMIENGENTLAYLPPKPEAGEYYIALINHDDNIYRLIYDSCSLIKVSQTFIEGTNIHSETYIEKIINFINSDNIMFNSYKPYVKLIDQYKYHDSHTDELFISKIIPDDPQDPPQNTELREINGKYFRPSDSTRPNLSITFLINADGCNLSFNNVKSYVAYACSVWNSISGVDVSFSYDESESDSTYDNDNSVSTITFETTGVDWGICNYNSSTQEGDIRFNANVTWTANGLRRSIVHEMGHVIGLGDMGNQCIENCHDDDETVYLGINNNIMWHSSYGMNWEIDSPQDGDKAGAIYCMTDFTETPEVDAIWTTNRMDNISTNISIPQNRTIEIEGEGYGKRAKFAPNKGIYIMGDLNITTNVYLDWQETYSSSWDGLYIGISGKLNIFDNGYLTINHADIGIEVTNSNGINNGNKIINILNSTNYGVFISNCSPTIRKFKLKYNGISELEGTSLLVWGSSANPSIRKSTIEYSKSGIRVSSSSQSSTNASVDSCDIRDNNIGANVVIAANCGIDLTGRNNITPNSGQLAIDNDEDSITIEANYNWWGSYYPDFESIIAYPELVFSPYARTSAWSSSVAGAKTILSMDKYELAQSYEFSGEYSSALKLYYEAFESEIEYGKKIQIITSILRALDQSKGDYSYLSSILKNELADENNPPWYSSTLDFIDTEILVREGRYQAAIDDFLIKRDKYSNTVMDVDILVRIAQIYGDALNDKKNALKYAKMSSNLNPGQENVRAAYRSAGMNYNPGFYEDRIIKNPSIGTKSASNNSVSVFPNPANPISNITYSIAAPSHVTLDIFSITGQKVATLVDDYRDAGEHTAIFDGAHLSSGLYLYRFRSESFSTTGRLMIVK